MHKIVEAQPPIPGQTANVRDIPTLSGKLLSILRYWENESQIRTPNTHSPKKVHRRLIVKGNTKYGIGWSIDGIDNKNELYDKVAADRVLRGAVVFNIIELLNAFRRERRCWRRKRPDQEHARRWHERLWHNAFKGIWYA